jgi:tetratricopeptide (TPR) repeat protein
MAYRCMLLFAAGLALPLTVEANDNTATFKPDASCDEALAQLKQLIKTARPDRPGDDSPSTQRQTELVQRMAKSTTADQLNGYGVRCHKQKRFEDSAKLFEWATAMDPKHALAHYNLACAWARLREAGHSPCGDAATYTYEIVTRVNKAVQLDPKRAERVWVDPDLNSLHNLLGIRLAAMGQPNSPADMAALFDGVELWGDTPGVALLAHITFKRTNPGALTGTVSGWKASEAEFDGIQVQGTWRADADSVTVDWATPSVLVVPGYSNATENIKLNELDAGGESRWFTSPDECSA